MGIHDIETMNRVTESLQKIDPSIFVYGEGWTAKDSPLAAEKRALKGNAKSLNHAAEVLKGGMSVAIAPEGTRSGSKELGPFKHGCRCTHSKIEQARFPRGYLAAR